jgi:hypothetical protein
MAAGPELSSISSALHSLTERITGMADSLRGSGRDDIVTALYEVERSLNTAQRRLDQVVDALL